MPRTARYSGSCPMTSVWPTVVRHRSRRWAPRTRRPGFTSTGNSLEDGNDETASIVVGQAPVPGLDSVRVDGPGGDRAGSRAVAQYPLSQYAARLSGQSRGVFL